MKSNFNISLKLLTQLSHLVTMMFGIALGISICILYQYKINLFIDTLSPIVLVIVLISGLLRLITLIIWKKSSYDFDSFDNQGN